MQILVPTSIDHSHIQYRVISAEEVLERLDLGHLRGGGQRINRVTIHATS
jgi:hypothetical protein